MRTTLIIILTLLGVSLRAQTIPPDREVLEKGEGGGMVSYAGINGYPGPRRILEMESKLYLSEEQQKDIQALCDGVQESAREKGDAIIKKEEQLESMFRSGKANESDVKKLSGEIAQLRGELRALHMIAHIEARKILTKEQLAVCNPERGTAKKQKHNK